MISKGIPYIYCMKYILIAIYLFITSSGILAQNTVESNVIGALSSLRTELIRNNIDEVQELANTLKLFKSWGINDNQLEMLIFQSQYAKAIYDYKDKDILKKIQKENKNEDWVNRVQLNHIAVLTSNPELCDFMNIGIISQDYPFQINPGSVFKELGFYGILPHESIADVGAGKGTFLMILYMAAQSNKLYYTEIEDNLINYFYTTINKGYLESNDSEIIMVKGKKKETKLPEPVDKIVLRSTFHHFKDKKAMLKSIKGSLKKDGKLFLKEYIDDQSGAEKPCRHVLTESEIKKWLQKAGFELTREMWMDKVLLMEYQIGDDY